LLLKEKSILGKRRAAQKLVDLLESTKDEESSLEEFLKKEYR